MVFLSSALENVWWPVQVKMSYSTYMFTAFNSTDHKLFSKNVRFEDNCFLGCDSIFYNKLPNNIKQTGNNNQFKKELKDLLNKGCYYSTDNSQ
jgi:hypothetical protein